MDTNDQIRATLISGVLNPWVGCGFLTGLIIGYAIGRFGI